MSVNPILDSMVSKIFRKILQSRGGSKRYISGPTTTANTTNTSSNSFMASQGYGVHFIMGARLIPSNLAIYLFPSLMIRCVAAAPAGTKPDNDNSNISPTVAVAIVVACLALPSAIWALLQIWHWFSQDNGGSPPGCMVNQILPELRSNHGTLGNIYGGNWSQNTVSSKLGKQRRGVPLSQEGVEEEDSLLGTPELSHSTTFCSGSRDGEGLHLRELNGRTAEPHRDQQRPAHASVSVAANGTTPPTASQTRMDLPGYEDERSILQQDA